MEKLEDGKIVMTEEEFKLEVKKSTVLAQKIGYADGALEVIRQLKTFIGKFDEMEQKLLEMKKLK